MAAVPDFPTFINVKYRGDGFVDFDRAVQATTTSARSLFDKAFGEIGRTIASATSRPLNIGGGLDLGVDKLREQAAQAKLNVAASAELLASTKRMASANGDVSGSTLSYIQALKVQTEAARGAVAVAEQDVIAHTTLQGALDKTASKTSALAQAHRALAEQQAQSYRAQVQGQEAQSGFTEVFAPGLSRKATDSGAGYGALAQQEAQRVALVKQLNADLATMEGQFARQAQQDMAAQDAAAQSAARYRGEMQALAAAERSAAVGAELLPAIYRNTGEALDFATGRARESALAFQQAEEAAVGSLRATLDQAIGTGRNKAGSLDVNVDGARTDAAALQAKATAARELAAAVQSAAREEGEFTTASQTAIAAADRFALEQDEAARAARNHADSLERLQGGLNRLPSATQAVVTGTNAGTAANRMATGGARQHKAAMVQLGQQFQDVAVQAQMGTSAFTIFAQQGSQVGFAMSGMKGKLGEVGTYLAGPWGALITVGAVALGALVNTMMSSGKEADKATDAYKIQHTAVNDLVKAIGELNKAKREEIKNSIDSTKAAIDEAAAVRTVLLERLNEALALYEVMKAAKGTPTVVNEATGEVQSVASQFSADLDKRMKVLRIAVGLAEQGVSLASAPLLARNAKEATDPTAAIQGRDRVSREHAFDAYDAALKRSGNDTAKRGAAERAYQATLEKINRTTAAEEKALQERNKRTRDNSAAIARDAISAPFSRPVQVGGISGRYGERREGRGHAGVDYAVPVGTPIYAPQSGTVTFLGTAGDYGNLLKVAHGAGTETRFAHLSRFAVERGQSVEKGDVIGYTGGARGAAGAGNSKGAHLHYEVRSGNKAVDPTKGSYPVDPSKVAEAEQKAAEQAQRAAEKLAADLARTVEQATGKVEGLNGQFQAQPTLIEKSARAVVELQAVIAGLAQARGAGTPGADEAAAEAERAIVAARQAVPAAINAQVEADQRAYDLQLLRAAGLEREADLRERLAQAEDTYGFDKKLTELQDALATQEASVAAAEAGSDAQKTATAEVEKTRAAMQEVVGRQRDSRDAIEDQIDGEERLARLRSESEEILRRRGQVIGTLRGELEALFSGEGDGQFFKNMSRSFNRFRGEVLTEQIFGPALKELEQWSQRNTPLGRATERFVSTTDRSNTALDGFTNAVTRAAGAVAGAPSAANDNGVPGVAGSNGFGAIGLAGLAAAGIGPFNGGIGSGVANAQADGVVITGSRSISETTALAQATARSIVDPLIQQFDRTFGTTFFSRMGTALRGGVEGYLRAGPIGGLLGAVRGLPNLAPDIVKGLDNALNGAEGGYQSSLILKSLGVKTSGTGGALGGAFGSFLGDQFGKSLGDVAKFLGPVGGIVGSLAGPLLGSLFKKAKFGGVTIGGVGGSLGVTGTVGNSGAAKRGGSEAADSVIGNLDRIAEQLNASVDASRGFVTVGSYNGKVRVNTEGTTLGGSKSPVKGLKDFGEDSEAAIRYAVLDLITDGVLVGLRAGTQRLLQNAKDLESGLADALKFESVFTRLQAYRDPVGAAMDTLDREFTRLQGIFEKAGASTGEYADLEALYGIERAKIIKEEGERITSALRGLLNDLTINNDARSLRNRLAEAQTVYDPLKARVEAGDRTAYDEFAVAARAMLDLQRQIYGSSSAYFSSLDDVTALTRKRIEGETNLVAITDGRDSPFTASGAAKGETATAIEGQTGSLLQGMERLGDRFEAGLEKTAAFHRAGTGGGGGSSPRNFEPSIAARAF